MSIDTSRGIAGLKGALRYVRAYRDQVFVVKLGGEVLGESEVLEQVTGQLALLSSLSIRPQPVILHIPSSAVLPRTSRQRTFLSLVSMTGGVVESVMAGAPPPPVRDSPPGRLGAPRCSLGR